MGPGFHIYGAGYIIDVAEGQDAQELPNPLLCRDTAANVTIPRPMGSGARHKAALRFVSRTKGSVAFVVSADGPITRALRDHTKLLTWPVWLSET